MTWKLCCSNNKTGFKSSSGIESHTYTSRWTNQYARVTTYTHRGTEQSNTLIVEWQYYWIGLHRSLLIRVDGNVDELLIIITKGISMRIDAFQGIGDLIIDYVYLINFFCYVYYINLKQLHTIITLIYWWKPWPIQCSKTRCRRWPPLRH